MAYVKLGAYDGYGLIKISDYDRLEKLVTEAQPANIVNISGKALDGDLASVTPDGDARGIPPARRDIMRAAYVAKVLKSIGSRA